MWLVWPVFGTKSEVTPRHDVDPGTQHERRSPIRPSPNLNITHSLSAWASLARALRLRSASLARSRNRNPLGGWAEGGASKHHHTPPHRTPDGSGVSR